MNDLEEKMVYKKLFNIKYNNKNFSIFIDQYGRRTFLEIDSSGKYIYPLIDDFIELHKIYNERDIFTTHYYVGGHLPLHKNPKVSFKERVRLTTGNTALILATVLASNLVLGTITSRVLKLEKEGSNIRIVVDYVDGTLIKNTNELDDILGYKSVSTEEIIEAINANDNITEQYKKHAIDLITFIRNKYPNADSRIFYENMKNMSPIAIKKSNALNKNIAGTYSSAFNVISLRDDYSENREVIIHELAHSYHHWKENKIGFPHYRAEDYGRFLDEAMTNKIIDELLPTNTYKQEGRVLEYFLSCVDYDYYDYEREGIPKLINLLKNKYANTDIDIDYIINAVDAITDTNYFADEQIKLEDNPQILDEIFKMCIHDMDPNSIDPYQPFLEFLKVVNCNKNYGVVKYQNLNEYDKNHEIGQQYLNEYNKILIEKGFNQSKTINEIGTFTSPIIIKDTKRSLREYISKLDIASLPKDKPYEPFKEFLEIKLKNSLYEVSSKEAQKLMCSLLDLYNGKLYCNGYTRDETITSEEVMEKIKQFKDMKIIGYAITQGDIICPIIDIKNADKLNIGPNKVFTLNEQGKITLLDKDDIISEKINYTGLYQCNFINSLFQSLDKDIPKFDQSYLKDLFKLKEYQYKKIPIYLNGIKLSEEYLEEYLLDTYVAIGQKDDGTNTFELGSVNQLTNELPSLEKTSVALLKKDIEDYFKRTISLTPEESEQLTQYLNDNYLKTKTAIIPLVKYTEGLLQRADDITSIELGYFLNEEYLKEKIAGPDLLCPNNPRYSHFTYDAEKDVVKVHPTYYITIKDNDKILEMNSIRLDLLPNNAYISIGGEYKNAEEFVWDNNENSPSIYLETVLDYYKMLDEDKENYYFSESEILELYNNYYQEVYINKGNKIIKS